MIVNQNPKKTISLPYLKTNVKKALKFFKLTQTSLEITLTSNAFIKKQNNIFRNINQPTDVLSFPAVAVTNKTIGKATHFKGKHLGDILISLDRAHEQAKAQGISLQKEVLFLIIHSILHLMGYDHATEKECLSMQKLESKALKKIYKPRNVGN
ncbi:rRNA maturation RNase YbeY [bacterium]|nr:rRNA maturation RNase YbeY [bacterium]MBU1917031.1 rRNA maturation RNase YbeY [bacterium]